jgi:hypothetical protein
VGSNKFYLVSIFGQFVRRHGRAFFDRANVAFLQIVESQPIQSLEQEAAAAAEQIKQKEEMILCLQVTSVTRSTILR